MIRVDSTRQRMGSSVAFITLVASIALVLPTRASMADLVDVYPGVMAAGHSNADGTMGDNVTLNFAVYSLGGMSATTNDPYGTGISNFTSLFTAGTGSSSLSTSSTYLYLYQVVNDSSSYSPTQISVPFNSPKSAITSWGYFTNGSSQLAFTDGQGTVQSGNPFGITGQDTPQTYSGSAPAILGVTSPGITANASGEYVPEIMSLTGSGNTSKLNVFTVMGLGTGQSTTLFGFTSNLPPGFTVASATDGTTLATGQVLDPSPEPGTLVMAFLGLPCAWFLIGRRKGLAVRDAS